MVFFGEPRHTAAAHAEGLACRGVKDLHGGGNGGAFPERVDRAAVKRLAGVLLVVLGVRLRHGHGLPDAFRLVRLHGRAADLGRERSGGGEREVAELLGVEPQARAAGDECVGVILLQLLRADRAGLAVGFGSGDRFRHVAVIPAAGDELRGEPIEQLRMRGARAHDAEIARGLHDAGPEEIRPQAVHGDAGNVIGDREVKRRVIHARNVRTTCGHQKRLCASDCAPTPTLQVL